MPGVRDVDSASESSVDALVPAPTVAAVRSCAHDAWAPLLREHTFASETVDLPEARACCAETTPAAHTPKTTALG
jgi:hypothetical protein